MCGLLFGINHNNESINELIGKMYDTQKTRGRNGFGFVEVSDDYLKIKRFVFEIDALDALSKSKSSHILFHHRIPTSTNNNTKSNHPICLENDIYKHNYYFIHNGHVTNADELRKEHEKRGIVYNTDNDSKFTDSEALAHELALVIEEIKEPKDFDAEGGMAFIMIQTDKFYNPVALYYGRNGSPLRMYQTKDLLVLRSEGTFEGELLDTDVLFRYDYKTKEITKKDVKFGTVYLPEPTYNFEHDGFIDKILNIYENRYILYSSLIGLGNKELTTLMVIAQKVASNNLMELERKLLSGTKEELGILMARYDNVIRTISNIELKLK